jgi:DNA mismatch repair protein MutS2
VSCRERDLAEPPKEGTRKKTRRANPDETPRQAIGNAPAGRIDLHGLTVDEAIARVVEEIDKAIRCGADRLEVVHGKGSGRIRNALHRELASLPVVASFRLDPRNAGVTWIFL